jgi:hypothetical protein
MPNARCARQSYNRSVRETDERKSLMDLRRQALISMGNCLMRMGDWGPAASASMLLAIES